MHENIIYFYELKYIRSFSRYKCRRIYWVWNTYRCLTLVLRSLFGISGAVCVKLTWTPHQARGDIPVHWSACFFYSKPHSWCVRACEIKSEYQERWSHYVPPWRKADVNLSCETASWELPAAAQPARPLSNTKCLSLTESGAEEEEEKIFFNLFSGRLVWRGRQRVSFINEWA